MSQANDVPSPGFHSARTGWATTVADTPRSEAVADCSAHPAFSQNHCGNRTTPPSAVVPSDGVTNVNDASAC